MRLNVVLMLVPLGSLASAAEKITFDDHVLPIFEQHCLNCHNPDKTKGGLDLSNYSGTIKGGSGGRVVEAAQTSSRLIASVKHSAEPVMPPEGDAIPGSQIKTLEAWIQGGLLENEGSKAVRPSKPAFDTSVQAGASQKPDGPPPMPEDVLLDPAVLSDRGSAIHAMAKSPWAPLLAVTGQGQVLLFDTEHLTLAGILPFPEGDPISLAFTPDARYLIVGGGLPGKSGTTVTFDVRTGERMLTASKDFDAVLCADIHPTLKSIVTGSTSKRIKLWSCEDGQQLNSIKKHTDWVTSLDISPNGQFLATGDRNGGVWIWESPKHAELHGIRKHQAAITALSFRSDSRLLATASEDGSVRLWDPENGKEIRKIDAHKSGVTAFGWGSDGSFATAGRDRKARLWKANFGSNGEIKKLAGIPTAIACDTAHQRIFIGSITGDIHVYSSKTKKHLQTLSTYPPSIESRLAKLEQRILSSNDKELSKLEGQRRYWERAALRRDILYSTKQLEETLQETEALHDGFQQQVHQVAQLSQQLAVKRNELRTLQSSAQDATGPEGQREEPINTESLEKTVHEMSLQHRRLEQEVLDLRLQLDEQLPVNDHIDRKIRQMQQEYAASAVQS